ncbi:hypothetical protein J4456_04050 [Candidatus Pacearchaeota archaeon]|nr:hypothetical protein [Candidatus Pacearchaeota archaeon]
MKCPTEEIQIIKKREIVYTDEKQFPWTQDPNGYFLVKIENNLICCGFVDNEHRMTIEFRGKNPDKIIKEIVKRNLCENNHLTYIAQELMLAHECLINNTKYTQR